MAMDAFYSLTQPLIEAFDCIKRLIRMRRE
jgi:hypothetical protein